MTSWEFWAKNLENWRKEEWKHFELLTVAVSFSSYERHSESK